ncbi:MAG: phosphatase PAP2 family protein [Pseudomonadota bacterium]|nr:phosphatase PAP2 family protein [Pseudomonadota bacterium]
MNFSLTTARRDVLWTLSSLALLLAWDFVGMDLTVMHWLGDEHGFVWRNHWFFSRVLHDGGRWLSAVAIVVVLVNVVRPWSFAGDMKLPTRLWWFSAMVICLVLIPTLKQRSATSCPWDLAEFGSSARYVSHWAFGVDDGGGGRCFPSGHASAAFSFLCGWFALRAATPIAARRWVAGVWVCGILFGIAQSVRGAHYPSHTLWTAWICWTTSVVLWYSARPWLALRIASPGAVSGR